MSTNETAKKPTNFADVATLHKHFRMPIAPSPAMLVDSEWKHRMRFMQEELDEFTTANQNCSIEDAADALVDLVYVAMGTAVMMGLPWQEVWDRVQAANMAKVRVEKLSESKRGSMFDLRKPMGWKAPDHSSLLDGAEWPQWFCPQCLKLGDFPGINADRCLSCAKEQRHPQ